MTAGRRSRAVAKLSSRVSNRRKFSPNGLLASHSPNSGPAECLAHPLVRLRWVHVAREASLVVERLCEHQQKLLKRREVFTFDRRLDHGLNTMIARYEGGIDGAHPDAGSVRMFRLSCKARAPPPDPCLDRLLINEQASKGAFGIRTIRCVAQPM